MFELVWVDNDINNFENQMNQKRIKQITNKCRFINSINEALKIIPNQKIGDKSVVIVSGSQIDKSPNLSLNSNQIVFQNHGNNNFHIFLEAKHILVFVESDISELEGYVKQNIEFLKAQESLNLSFCKKVEKKLEYNHEIEETSFKFLLINQKLQKNFQESETKLDDEISKLIGQTSLYQLKKQVQKNSDEKKQQTGKEFTLFEKLIYYYTTNYLYDTLNTSFAESNYEGIEQIICTLFDGYSKLKQQQLTQNVYRGIAITNATTFNQIVNQLKQCKEDKNCIFWNTLTSTSKDINVAKHFLRESQSILFEITLSKINPHPGFIFESYNSRYPVEEEVLLFPQFQFQILEINPYNGKNYYCRIQQIENNFSMALNNNTREKYWLERINNDLKPKLRTLASFYQIRINYLISRIRKHSLLEKDRKTYLKTHSDDYFYKLVSLLQQFCDNQLVHENYLSQLLQVLQQEFSFYNDIKEEFLQELKNLYQKSSECLINEFILVIKKIYNLEEFRNNIQKLVQISIQQAEMKNKYKEDFYDELASNTNFEINFSIVGNSLDEISYQVKCNPKAEQFKYKYCNLKVEYVAYFDSCSKLSKKQIPLFSDDFNPKFNKSWDGYSKKEQRGPSNHRYDYYYPKGCFGFGLNVERYGQNQDWLKKDGNFNEWRILFHGTSIHAVSSIVKNNLLLGPYQLHQYDTCIDEHGNQVEVGYGVYFTDIMQRCIDQGYASFTNIGGKYYAAIIMARVNPNKIRQSQEMRKRNYYLVNNSSDIRPYRILIYEKK